MAGFEAAVAVGCDVSVVVPCHNEAGFIVALLDAIAAQDRLPGEVVVVDDASTDGTSEVIERWMHRHPELDVRIVGGAGRGAGAAMNLGIHHARGDVIVRLDGHSEPAPDYLRLALETLSLPGAGVVGGVWAIEPAVPTRFGRVIAAVLSHPSGSGGVAYRNEHASVPGVRRVDTVPFGCFRRSCWQALGGFDEGLIGNQDYDFNYRARRAGHDVVLNSRMKCVYRSRSTLRALAHQYHRYGFWKRQMLRKSPTALRWRQIPPALVLPWLALTAALAATTGHLAAVGAAAAYPAVVMAGAFVVALKLRDVTTVPLAAVAIATVHLSWSAGFWRGLLTRRPDLPSQV